MYNNNTKNNRLRFVNANLFTEIQQFSTQYNIIVPHVCNNKGVFGGGFTSGIRKYFPIVEENYSLLGKKCILGYTQFVIAKHDKISDKKIIFANMLAQNGTISKFNSRPLNYFHLAICMKNVHNYIMDNFDFEETQIHCPKFGSGLAGGNWKFIQDLITDIWVSTDTVVYQI